MESGVVDGMELLEWLQTGVGDERDLQLMALEQLCMTLLMSDNIDRCFESCPPRTFLPALGRIFVDESAPENILEVTARAITYYLDVSNECTRRITQVDGAIKAICNRLIIAQMNDRTSKDLAEQCVKLLEHICQREASAVYDAGGLQAMLHLISHHDHLHKDTMHSAMAVITKLCAKMEPNDPNLAECGKSLGELLSHDDEKIAECALRCFAAMTDRFIRRQMDPQELAQPSNLVTHLFDFLLPPRSSDNIIQQSGEVQEVELRRNSAFISAVLSLFANLCKGSSTVTTEILHSPKLVNALKIVLNCKDERCINDCLRFIDLLLVLFCEGRASISKHSAFNSDISSAQIFDKVHRSLIDSIRQRDTDALIDSVENGTVDPNYVDDVGQTLLNWCAAFGTSDMVIYLCDKGADPNKGQRSSSLHYAACFGRTEIVKILLRYGASPDLQDEDGRTALDKARERNDEAHQQVCEILQNPGTYMSTISSAIPQKRAAPQEASRDNEKEKIDYGLAENFIQQLLPVLCTIFKNSLSAGIRRITLPLIRKCIFHISNEGLMDIICTKGTGEMEKSTGLSGFVELLIGVLIIILESGENNIDAKEQSLMIIKSLLLKNSKFWSEQLIRLGVCEKIESLAAKTVSSELVSSSVDTDYRNFANNRPNILSNLAEDKKEGTVSDKLTIASSYDRSTTSTPSVSLRSDSTAPSDFRAATEPVNVDVTPSPTIEILQRQSSSAPIEDDNQTLETEENDDHSEIDSPAFDNDLVEAATTIAQALGVQIVQDAASKSDEQNTASTEDVWTIEQKIFYRWKDWRLIRAHDSLFVWCDAVALELSDGSNGWLRFLMNGRLSTLYSSGSPEYSADNAEMRVEFIEKIQKAKATVPSGAQTKPILSTPQASARQIQSGNWLLSSTELGTLSITNREGIQQKLCIKEDLPGFIFESSKNHRQVFTAESTLGHDFVTGWAARGGGRRLRYFRVEVQKQKINELAKEIWEIYLKEACDRPREAVLEIQKCSERLGKLAKEINEMEAIDEEIIEIEIKLEELASILTKIRDSLSDDRLLSIFEISISGLVPALLELVEIIESNKTGVLAKQFAKIFADANDLSSLVRKIVLVLESVEKFPQCLYDSPGGSPFGFQLLTRRLRFRFENANPQSKEHSKDSLIDITNRSLKTEPLVTVFALKAYLYEQISNPKTTTSQAGSTALSNLHYTRPPTAASLRMARKLPKMTEKLAAVSNPTSSSFATSESKKSHGPSEAVLSARSAYMAAGCLEKVGGNIKVKQSTGKFAGPSSKASSKKGNSMRPNKTLSSSRGHRLGQQKELSMEKSSNEGGNGAGSSNMTQQQQKSMSTTNLFDVNYKKSRASASTFNQAASAESLQHQTPSLENLLSKARLHDYSIPEESMATPNSGSPEPKNLPTFENLPSRFEKRKGSENAQSLSIGASTFAGGSQPVLNSSSFSHERFQNVDSSTEKLEEQTESSMETINENMQKQEQEVAELLQFMDGMDGQFMVDDDDFGGFGAVDVPHIDEFPGSQEHEVDILEQSVPQIQRQISESVFEMPTSSVNAAILAAKQSQESTSTDQPGTSATAKGTFSSASSAAGTSSNIGSNIRGKLGSYADMLKHMMNQVFEGGDSGEMYEGDDFDNDIYEDELLSQYFIEQECEPHISDGHHHFSISSDSSSVAGFVEQQQQQPTSSSITTTTGNMINDATTAFESISHAAGSSRAAAVAAIRAAMDRNDSIFYAIHQNPLEVVLGPGTTGDQRQRWRQMLMEELVTGGGDPSSSNNNENYKMHMRGGQCDAGCARAIRIGANRAQLVGGWNDDFVLRQQFGALIPAFDPRPGRTNVNQTQEVELSDNVQFSTFQRKGSILTEEAKSDQKPEKLRNLRLHLKKINKTTQEKELVELKDDDLSLFYYVQQLNQKNSTDPAANNKMISQFPGVNTQIWDNTYTLVYNISNENDSHEEGANEGNDSKEYSPLVFQALKLVQILNGLNQATYSVNGESVSMLPTLSLDVFNSSKLTQKLCQEITDPLVVSSKTMPQWCNHLVYNYSCLFSIDTRMMYLNTTAFGTSRAIGYLQNRRDQLLEQNRSATSTAGTNMAGLRREDHYPEYRIGRVKHERIKVHRNEELFMENAIKVLKFHAMRKSILEIEYYGEEGTGLGPTLEFFALIASEFQRKDLCMWICDDSKDKLGMEEDADFNQSKPPGYYVHSNAGLFPAPWPAKADISKTLELFQVFGVYLAKAIQDDRLLDLPLSPAFIKLILSPNLATGASPSIESVLDMDDFAQIFPEKAKILKALKEFANRRNLIQANDELDCFQKAGQIERLQVDFDGSECALEDLDLNFAVNAPSRVFPYYYAELIENGLTTEVTAQNVDLYIQKCIDFYMSTGIREQMLAFRNGFDMVFPLASLIPFTASELQTILSGEQCPKWTREDLLRFTEPKLGYTRDSPGFLNFVEVLANFTANERKAFLQFTTGCSSLPPGGLANLHPRLTIVRKVGSGDGSYPSVNTCVHYLKLPEYSSAEILRERLLAATFEKGFHLN